MESDWAKGPGAVSGALRRRDTVGGGGECGGGPCDAGATPLPPQVTESPGCQGPPVKRPARKETF